jgi:uncharacterized membrane protein YuzA (DUF378 family)
VKEILSLMIFAGILFGIVGAIGCGIVGFFRLSVGQRWFIGTMWAIILLSILNDRGVLQ